jgi:hypothetical protein
MNDDLWHSTGKGKWQYVDIDSPRWMRDTAHIVVYGKTAWHLFINRTYVATFNTWGEARDATPMMIKLHGYESKS